MSHPQTPPPPGHTPQAPQKKRAALWVTLTALAAVVAFFGAGALAQAVNDDPDPAACKAAIKRNFDRAMAAAKPSSQLSECDGVDEKTLERFVGEILLEAMGDS